MKDKCCRSAPRCAGCPVLAVAALKRRRELDAQSRLIAEIIGGAVRPELPASVVAELRRLDAARLQVAG